MLPDELVQRGQPRADGVQRLPLLRAGTARCFRRSRSDGRSRRADLTYLANLCHNCGECLYACQFAPPHEFGINVPSLLAEVRTRSYEAHAWPSALGLAFRRNAFRTGLAALALAVSALLLASLVARAGARRLRWLG